MAILERIAAADRYLSGRTGCYEWRCTRYAAVADTVVGRVGTTLPTLVDVGAGATELARYLYAERGWRGRYYPVDACFDGVDLDEWSPARTADWFVALELIEHLSRPLRLLAAMKRRAVCGVVVSTPNPETTDVLGMDPTHRTPVTRGQLEALGFGVEVRSFYGQEGDSLYAVWMP